MAGERLSEQAVQVSGGPVRLIAPELKEHGTLQHEHIPVCGLTQSVQEPFQSIMGAHELKVFSLRPR